jgi:molybdenum cofactor cytidylyltransferase
MKIAGVILAAGCSSRMGQPKQALPFRGATLLRIAAEAALDAGCDPVFVVLGAVRQEISNELARLPVHIVENEDWRQGIGSSIGKGVEAAARLPIDALVLMLADQPLVDSRAIRRLMDAARSGHALAASEYASSLGAPAVFARSLFTDLLRLDPSEGARKLIADPRHGALAIPLPEAAMDIDTPEDYRRALHSIENSMAKGKEAHSGA